MPIISKRFSFRIARLNALFSLKAGIGRDKMPDIGAPDNRLEAQARQLRKARDNTAKLRDRLSEKNREIIGLRADLTRAQNGTTVGRPRDDTPLFFIVGRGRSGTTWLQNILNSHPEILCRGEGYLFDRNYRQEEFRQFKESHPRLQVTSLYNAILNAEHLRMWLERSVWTAGEDVQQRLDDLTRLAVDHILTERLSKTNKRIVGDKTPFVSAKVLYEMDVNANDRDVYAETGTVPYNGAEVLGEISRILPGAKVIHIIRDGRDVAVSFVNFLWNQVRDEGGLYSLTPEELRKRDAYRTNSGPTAGGVFTEKRLRAIANAWRAEVGLAVETGPALLGDRYAQVYYEDLLNDPNGEVRALLEFLGADADDETVADCVEKSGFERLANRKRGQEDHSSIRHRKGVAGDWKNVFTENDRRIFKEQAGDLLIDLGYERNHDW